MGKIRSFLGFLATLFAVFFACNSFAVSFNACTDIKKYTSCVSGRYLSDCGSATDGRTISSFSVGNTCLQCPSSSYECKGGTTCPKLTTITVKCNAGYYMGVGDTTCSRSCEAGHQCPENTYTIPASGASSITNKTPCSGRTQYSASKSGSCSTVSNGYYTTGCNSYGNVCTGQSQCTGATYCSGGIQNDCPTGYTADTSNGKTDNTQCKISVDGGKYIAVAKESSASGTCAAGTYKAAHTVAYNSTSSCSNCSGRTAYSAAGAASCSTVSSGYYTTGGTTTTRTGQSQCKDATYCSGGVKYDCPTGYTADTSNGKTANTQCKISVADGKYIAVAKESAASGTCAAGTYKAAHTVAYNSTSSCSNCSGRTAYSAAGASSCSTVSSGYYTTGCNSSGNACTGQSKCESDYYCSGGVRAACTSWRANTNTNGVTGATSTDACVCAAGYRLNKSACSACACGTYKSVNSNATSCTNTDAGYYASGDGNTGQTEATAGYYAAAGACSQTACGDVTKYSAAGAASCSTVSSGYFTTGGTTTTRTGQSQCTGATYCSGGVKYDCPTGYTADISNGKIANTQCKISVDGGKYIAVAKESAASGTCEKGTYKAAHTVAYNSTSSCSKCSCGTYASSTGASSCTKTSDGYYASGEGNTGQTKASAGYYAAAGACLQTACTAPYSNSMSGSDDVNDCYLKTTATKYVAEAGKGEVSCVAGGYCAGGSIIYKGGSVSGRSTTGGRTGCPANSYCTAGVSAAATCLSLGSFYTTALANSDEASDCYGTTTAKNYVKTAKSGEELCTAGGFCPGSVSVYYGSTGGRTGCIENSDSLSGSDDISDCYCNAGYGGNAGVSGGKCTYCSGGTYKTNSGNASCSICTANYYCTGGTGHTACTANSSSESGSDAITDCYCNAGFGGDAGTSGGKCTACAIGAYKSAVANTSCSLCSNLSGVSVSGGEYYTDDVASTTNKACKYMAPDKSITGCSSVATIEVTYDGIAWPKTPYTVVAGTGYLIANNTTPTATCNPISYTIVYDSNKPDNASDNFKVEMQDTIATYDKSVVLSANEYSLDGWTFTGWNTKKNGSGTKYNNSQEVINLTSVSGGVVTLYAQWSANKYTVTYAKNKPSNASSEVTGTTANNNHVYDTPSQLTTNGYSLTGWTFTGWNTSADGKGQSYSDKATISTLNATNGGTTTLYAQWSANIFTINYSNGGNGATGDASKVSVECRYDDKNDSDCYTTTQGKMFKQFYTYQGWTTEKNGVLVEYPVDKYIGTIITGGSITLYAVWDACPAANMGNGVAKSVLDGVTENVCRYTHTCSVGFYNANHLKQITSHMINCSPCTNLPDNAKWTSSALTDTCAWKCDECQNGANAMSCSLVQDDIARTCTYAGTCDPNTFNPVVTGSTISCTVCPRNSFVDADNVATYCTCSIGHTTNQEANGPNTTNAESCKPISNYKITYETNGGDNYLGGPDEYTYGVGAVINGVPTRTGYTFLGWCSDASLNSCAPERTISTSATGDKRFYAKWSPNEYTITIDKNGATGEITENVKCVFDSGQCRMPQVSSLLYPGYVVTGKLCETANGDGKCYDAGSIVTNNLSPTANNMKLYVMWKPNVFKVKLLAADATANAEEKIVYLKYTVGWYSDSSAKNQLININDLPQKTGYVFAGYQLSNGTKNVKVVNADGIMNIDDDALMVTTTDTTASVVWDAGITHCPDGYYYKGYGNKCTLCEANNWCPEGDYNTDSNVVGGLNPCPDGGLSSGGIAAYNPGVCYKNLLNYESVTKHATGTQSCFYNEETDKYNLSCYNKVVEACAAGYWYVSGADCSEVGKNYYSVEGDMLRTPCPVQGLTDTLNSGTVTQCYKTVNYTAKYGKGNQVCNYIDDTYGYADSCRDINITSCVGGYYRDVEEATDCVPVGKGFYSFENTIDKIPCPRGGDQYGTTDEETAYSATSCYIADYPFATANGSGVRYCNYDTETFDYTTCKTKRFMWCKGGYWWAKYGDEDCVAVGIGYFGPVVSDDNGGYLTGRQACPAFSTRRGTTANEFGANAGACYMTGLSCAVADGTGVKQCWYDMSESEYSKNCSICQVTLCSSSYYLDNNECTFCPEDYICDDLSRMDKDGNGMPDGKPLLCKTMFGNKHPYADPGSTRAAQCWGVCELLENVVEMIGRDYYDDPDTCEIRECKSAHYLTANKSACLICPENHICAPDTSIDDNEDGLPDAAPKTCSEISGGIHPYSPVGSTEDTQCYAKCEEFDLIGGRAYPRQNIVHYGSGVCEYLAMSDSGNPCKIQETEKGLACVEVSCNPDFELVDGRCQECKRDHATAYKPNGNCLVAKCHENYHPEGDKCVEDTNVCSAPNSTLAEHTWNHKLNAYGACIVKKCEDGYHVASNACVPDVQTCEIKNGTGMREWDGVNKKWGECQVTSCKPGYTNDPRESNEPIDPSKKCGACKNTFGLNGQVAVSSWISGCEIAACMYQGELYNLENNKCVIICNRKPDETGTMRWDDTAKKCIRECKPGYTAW